MMFIDSLFLRLAHWIHPRRISSPQQMHDRPVSQQQDNATTDTRHLNILRDRNILVVADDENLRYSARDLGLLISYNRLGKVLRETSRRCGLHAIFSHEAQDRRRIEYFAARGWTPHGYRIQTVDTHRGSERLANSDNLILFTTGLLASREHPEIIVIASGDGTLVCDIAAFLAFTFEPIGVVTLSFPHSTSARLDARRNDLIAANLEIGQDCLKASGSALPRTRGLKFRSRLGSCRRPVVPGPDVVRYRQRRNGYSR